MSMREHGELYGSASRNTIIRRSVPCAVTGRFPQRDNTEVEWYNNEVGYKQKLTWWLWEIFIKNLSKILCQKEAHSCSLEQTDE